MLSRFEKENGGELLVAALCLLEVSKRGLLESELLTILGDEENMMPADPTAARREFEETYEKGSKHLYIEQLYC